MKDLARKVPSEATAKKVVIGSLAGLILSAVASFVCMMQVYSLAGEPEITMGTVTSSVDHKLKTIQTTTHTLVAVSYVCIALMILAGIVLVIHHEAKAKHPKA